MEDPGGGDFVMRFGTSSDESGGEIDSGFRGAGISGEAGELFSLMDEFDSLEPSQMESLPELARQLAPLCAVFASDEARRQLLDADDLKQEGVFEEPAKDRLLALEVSYPSIR